jgi:acyl-CoA synthetase (AMP-forming)/AMP-acid ligase II
MTPRTGKYRTSIEAVLALHNCTRRGARFVRSAGGADFYPYADILRRALAAAGGLQARGVRPGEVVPIILPTCVEFFDTFLGVQLAGGIPAALYPPLRLGKLDEYFGRTRRMLQKVDARLLITDRRVRQLLGPAVDQVSTLQEVVDADSIGSGSWSPVDVDPDSPAFLQFSSGTTLEPKAVMISHGNLFSNLEMMNSFFQQLSESEAEQGGVCWVPLYHDMGLLGHMFMGLYHPGTVTYIGPELFIAKPKIWLQTLSQYKGVASAAPDFAYAVCTAKIRDEDMEGVDLSHWKVAFNGAEPINVETMQRFAERFSRWGFRPEAMTPVYGLAEAGLAVTFSDLHTAPTVTQFDRARLSARGEAVPGAGRRLTAVGRPLPGMEVRIRDEHGADLPDQRVGHIHARGPSITRGYFGDPELSARLIRDGWLDTGDLGFFHAGELYISGRAKDLIIIRGRNYAPQEIEQLLSGISGLRPGCWVALGGDVDGSGEQLIVLAERDAASPRPEAELVADIKGRILSGIALVPYDTCLLAPGTLPRTSSGKLRRSEALRLYQTGQLRPPDQVGPLQVAAQIGRSRLAWSRFWLRRLARRSSSSTSADSRERG